MSELHDHIIQKIGYDVTLQGGGNGLAFQQALDSWSTHQLMPALETLFDRFSEDQTVIEIEQLSLDIQLDFSDDWETELLKNIIEEVERQLLQKVKSSADPSVVRRSLIKDRLEQWLYFLEKGYLPWQSAPVSEKDWQEAILSELASQGPSWKRFKQVLVQHQVVRNRLLNQYDDAFLSKLVAISTRIAEKEVTALQTMILSLLEIIGRKKRYSAQEVKVFRSRFWTQSFEYFVVRSQSKLPISAFLPSSLLEDKTIFLPKKGKALKILQEWIKRLNEKEESLVEDLTQHIAFEAFFPSIKVFIQQITDRDISLPDVDTSSTLEKKEVTQTEKSQLTDSETPSFPEEEAKTTDDHSLKSEKEETADESSAGSFKKGKKEIFEESPKTSISEQENARTAVEKKDEPAEEEVAFSKVDPAHKKVNEQDDPSSISKDQPDYRDMEFPESESLYINHAGIVILHPFLPRFFDMLGLLENKDFKNEEARQRAVHLLHFLASGQPEAPEYEMMLAKLLCHVPFQLPIDRDIQLEESETQECEDLLQAITEHWEALGKSSPEAVRESFLQREGKLEKTADGWHLYVEQKALDILVERIPWSIGFIQLHWMPEPLWVHWIA